MKPTSSLILLISSCFAFTSACAGRRAKAPEPAHVSTTSAQADAGEASEDTRAPAPIEPDAGEADEVDPDTPLRVFFVTKEAFDGSDVPDGVEPEEAFASEVEGALARSVRRYDVLTREQNQELTELARGAKVRVTSHDALAEDDEPAKVIDVEVGEKQRLYASDCYNLGEVDTALCHGSCCKLEQAVGVGVFGGAHNTADVYQVCFDVKSKLDAPVLPLTSIEVLVDQCDAGVSEREEDL